MTEPVTVPLAAFGGDNFWRHLNQLADRDHEGHPRALVGHSNPDNRYTLHCQRCDTTIAEMTVDRTSA